MYLHILPNESRMRLLSIAAASLNSSSPAMLITRQGGRVGCALAVAYCQDECIVKRSAKIAIEAEL